MFVMAAMADAMTGIVEKSAGFQLDAGLRRQMVDGLQLVKQHDAEFANMLGVLPVVIEAAAKGARGGQHLASLGVVTMWLFARESFARNFLQKSFTDADAGDEEAANIKVAAEHDKDNGGDAHDVGTIAANAVRFHAGAEIALQNVGKALAQQG